MFQKLNISLSELDFVKLKGENSFDLSTFKEFSIIDTDYLFSTLSKQVQFDVKPNVNITEITFPGATPHTDTWPSAINFYFDIGDDETFFWKEINVSPDTKKGLVFYDPKKLEQIGYFKANKGDCYLLDVGNSIHSVKMHTPNTTRRILRLYWQELSYNQVLQSLKFV
jgi:hypothetical protein